MSVNDAAANAAANAAALTRLYVTVAAFGAAAMVQMRRKMRGTLQRLRHFKQNVIEKTISPYLSQSDLCFFVFLLALWLLLYLACFYENPDGLAQGAKEMGLSVITLPFSTGLLLLEKVRTVILGLPDLWPGTVNAQSPQHSFHGIPNALNLADGLSEEDLVRKIMSDPNFQVQIRRVALQELEPIRRDILDFSDKKLKEFKEQVQELRSKDLQDAEVSFKEKLSSLEDQIERKLADRVDEMSFQAEADSNAKYEELRQKMQGLQDSKLRLGESSSTFDATILTSRIDDLQSRLDNIKLAFEENEEVARMCCKTDAEMKADGDKLLSQWLNEVVANNSKTGKEFNAWLESQYVTKQLWKSDLELLKASLATSIESEVINEAKKVAIKSLETFMANGSVKTGAESPPLPSEENVLNLINDAIKIYDADKTGRFDFALESAGGTIASIRCTETHDVSNAVYSLFGIPFWWEKNNPRTILQPGASPGQCWAFKGSHGSVVVKLSEKIIPEAVTLEHMSKIIAPDHTINSAPKDFAIYGLEHVEDPNPVHLGNFTYVDNGIPVQTFELIEQNHRRAIQFVEFKVKSNHGHLVYTCMYRLRVHGSLA